MRVYCRECSARGRITKTHRLSCDTADLYCQCTDAECGHCWVMQMSYSRQLSPSTKTSTQLALQLLRQLPKENRQFILDGLNID
ncbi:ogr/Delta-like zinc finger family protein [Aeromonas hydrophila]|uniref:ogr/Delta-like zinc finger family protein n=1 Tax=Aeromonas hydrophila TaxID=644 RepID=UPI0009B89D92|nr:ogr/Delta-like zinc finger family protein [Aeromonas hydrophila]